MAEILIERFNSRKHRTEGFRYVSPEGLAPRHLKDEGVRDLLEAMKQDPKAIFAIVENSRRVLRVIPLNVSGAFKPTA